MAEERRRSATRVDAGRPRMRSPWSRTAAPPVPRTPGRSPREIVALEAPSANGKRGETALVEGRRGGAPRHDAGEARLSARRSSAEGGTVTAGNASQINDGAALPGRGLRERGGWKELGKPPLARVVTAGAAGVDTRRTWASARSRRGAHRAGARRPDDRRPRPRRDQRGVRRPGPPRACASSAYPAREAQRQWRRHRARPPARLLGRPARGHAGLGAARARRPLRNGRPVHRCGPGAGDRSPSRTSTVDAPETARSSGRAGPRRARRAGAGRSGSRRRRERAAARGRGAGLARSGRAATARGRSRDDARCRARSRGSAPRRSRRRRPGGRRRRHRRCRHRSGLRLLLRSRRARTCRGLPGCDVACLRSQPGRDRLGERAPSGNRLLRVAPLDPPLPLDDRALDLAVAISIWSHYGATAATLAWRRCIAS